MQPTPWTGEVMVGVGGEVLPPPRARPEPCEIQWEGGGGMCSSQAWGKASRMIVFPGNNDQCRRNYRSSSVAPLQGVVGLWAGVPKLCRVAPSPPLHIYGQSLGIMMHANPRLGPMGSGPRAHQQSQACQAIGGDWTGPDEINAGC